MIEYFKTCLNYDKDTGVFTWKERANKPNNWNGRFSGKVAGGLKQEGYITIAIDAVPYYAHRLAWMFIEGEIPEGMLIDHINGNRADNSIKNLRLVTEHTNAMNTRNRVLTERKPTSQYKGVHKRESGRYSAQITFNNVCKHLGTFDSEEDAAIAYDIEATKLFGEYAKLNFNTIGDED